MRFHFLSRFGSQNLLGNFGCSRAALSTASISGNSLYRRISPIGDPNVSIVPVLEHWVEEGKTVSRELLQGIIKDLKAYRRFKHALEASYWMSDRRYIPLSADDVATRLNLISRLHGIDQAENYFNNTSEQLKNYYVYIALLSCYARENCLDKAEDLMQKMRSMGFTKTPLCYNVMMNLYYRMKNWDGLDMLMHEMEENDVPCDRFTLSIRLSAYVAASNIEGIDHIVTRMDSDPHFVMDYNTCRIVADRYLKVGLVDKALETLKKAEQLLATANNKSFAYNFLLKLYAKAGKKDEVYRIWALYEKDMKIYNKGNMHMISALIKLDDIKGAEEIFEKWESKKLSYDFRIPNFLISVYCRTGLLEKAEALLFKGIDKGGNPNANTWYHMANGYIEDNQIPKAVEALKKASSISPPGWRPSRETTATCLLYLEGKGDINGTDEFMRLLEAEKIFSAAARDRFLSYIKDGELQPSAVD